MGHYFRKQKARRNTLTSSAAVDRNSDRQANSLARCSCLAAPTRCPPPACARVAARVSQWKDLLIAGSLSHYRKSDPPLANFIALEPREVPARWIANPEPGGARWPVGWRVPPLLVTRVAPRAASRAYAVVGSTRFAFTCHFRVLVTAARRAWRTGSDGRVESLRSPPRVARPPSHTGRRAVGAKRYIR